MAGADPREATAERRSRALLEPLDVRPRPDPRFVRLEVRNPAHGTHYTVVLPAYPARDGGFCTCTDFAKRGLGTCKHLEAVWLWADEHSAELVRPSAAPTSPRSGARWSEIDRRLRGVPKSELPAARRLRWPGAALLTEE